MSVPGARPYLRAMGATSFPHPAPGLPVTMSDATLQNLEATAIILSSLSGLFGEAHHSAIVP
jgi:hypothetical protein